MKLKKITVVILFIITSNFIKAQQFNSDNYVTMPHGTGTFVITTGERDAMISTVFTLLKNFEFNIQANLYWEDRANNIPNRYTTNVFGKYMFWENKQKNGGAAVFLGIGKSPGYFTIDKYSDMQKNYWTAVPVSIPFLNTVFWDIMPGAMVNFDYNDENVRTTAWGFTYSTRLAIYKVIPETAIVGEIFGTEGKAYSQPEYKVGLRWEPNSWIVLAGTYGAALNGNKGAGFELGIVIFTPSFLKKDFIKNNVMTY
ncbi:hypothetical protein EC396_01830 [Lutibacter sp. HS1-25]|uniref:hypothetical protein n=1 Tax=Lutibacter sp. HS1-25 TaxID=2485000 RepID=UPI001013864B|nr:hypothetical protein [Lutibacter sp. HS1-25]RXP63568.1 hypothetical protein EC396_01830 [Lutibacter sp. HS1-25]